MLMRAARPQPPTRPPVLSPPTVHLPMPAPAAEPSPLEPAEVDLHPEAVGVSPQQQQSPSPPVRPPLPGRPRSARQSTGQLPEPQPQPQQGRSSPVEQQAAAAVPATEIPQSPTTIVEVDPVEMPSKPADEPPMPVADVTTTTSSGRLSMSGKPAVVDVSPPPPPMEDDIPPPPEPPPPIDMPHSPKHASQTLLLPAFLQHKRGPSGGGDIPPPTAAPKPPSPIPTASSSSSPRTASGVLPPSAVAMSFSAPTTTTTTTTTKPALPPPRAIMQALDEISLETIAYAAELEDVFVNALECLIDNYRQPLLTKLGKLASQDLDVVFRDVEQLLGAARDAARRLHDVANSGAAYWLATVYTDVAAYLPAYRKFIASHAEGILRLNTLKTSNKQFAAALAACTCNSSKFAQETEIEDLFWMATSRVRHVLQLAQSQRNHRYGSDQLAAGVAASDSFMQRYRSSPIAPVQPPPPEETGKADEALKQLGDLQLNVVRLDELHSGLGVVRQIRTASQEDIPANINRKLMELLEVVVQNKNEFGLSTEVPAVLMFFSDGMALCLPLPPGSRHRYQLLEWYKLAQMMMTDTQSKTKTPTLRVARKVATSTTQQALPPGWEEIVKGSKRTYQNKTLGVTQQQRPERISVYEGTREILTRNQEAKETCIRRFRELSGTDLTAEQKSPPYVIIGSNLEPLMLHEQSLSPGITVPLLVKRICHHIISHGLGEQGIFRVGGEKRFLEELRQAINTGHLEEIKFEQQNINLISGLLKLFLRDMPQPLIPCDLYSAFLAVPEMPEERQVAELARLLAKLPKINLDLMRELMSFEFQIACNEHVNSMTPSNLAIVTSPNILRREGAENMLEVNQANGVVGIMIQKFLEVFESGGLGEGGAQEWVTFKRKLLGHNKGIRMLIQSASGERMLSIDGDGAVYVWSAGKCSFVEQTALEIKYPNCAILVGENFWIGSQQGIFVYNSDTNALVAQIPRIVATSLLLVGSEVWCGSEGKIVVVNSIDFKPIGELAEENATMVFCLTLVGECIWSAGFCKGKDQEIHVWDRFTRRRVAHFVAHKKRINALAVHGGNVWSCSDDFSICVWNATRYTRLATIERHQGAVYGFCVLPDQVWSCSWDKTIMIWEPVTFRCLGEIKGYHTDSVCSLVPVRRSDTAAVDIWSGSFDKALCVWSVRTAPTVVPLH